MSDIEYVWERDQSNWESNHIDLEALPGYRVKDFIPHGIFYGVASSVLEISKQVFSEARDIQVDVFSGRIGQMVDSIAENKGKLGASFIVGLATAAVVCNLRKPQESTLQS